MTKQTATTEMPLLLVAVQSATEADLEAVRSRIEDLQNELDSLCAVEKVVEIKLHGKPKRAMRANKNAGGKSTTSEWPPSEVSSRLYDEIAKNGPDTPLNLANRIGSTAQAVGIVASKNAWFKRDGGLIRIAMARE